MQAMGTVSKLPDDIQWRIRAMPLTDLIADLTAGLMFCDVLCRRR